MLLYRSQYVKPTPPLRRTIKPHGHLHTFDFHENRVKAAREEFALHKIDSCVTVAQRDVCQDGFGLQGVADAVFLDLPHPWDAIPHAKNAMKPAGGRICSFSPCIEQVQRAAEAMRQLGFKEISTMECLLREFQVKKISMPTFDETHESREVARNKKRKVDEDGAVDRGEDDVAVATDKDAPRNVSFLTGLPLLSTAGHTGYLTFATLPAQQ